MQKVCYLCGGKPTENMTRTPTIVPIKQHKAALFLPPIVQLRTVPQNKVG